MDENRLDDEENRLHEEDSIEAVLLSPPGLLYDDSGQIVQSLTRKPLAVMSPPQQSPRRRHTPFKEPCVDRRSKTPMYNIVQPTAYTMTRPTSTGRRSSTSSLNHSQSTARHSTSSSNTLYPQYRTSESNSQLFGEVISFEEDATVVSSVVDSRAPVARHAAFDIETGMAGGSYVGGVVSPGPYGGGLVSLSTDESNLSPQPPQRPIQTLFKQCAAQLNRDLIRTSHVATNELANIVRIAKHQVLRLPEPLTPSSADNLNDLEYLQNIHRGKVEQLSNVQHDDHFDFCLVLTPQAVYEFWADLLDFRAEQLGEEAVADASSPQTQGTEETQNSDDDPPVGETLDARPFTTPKTGIRRRRGQFSNEETPSIIKETPKAPHTTYSGIQFSAGLLSVDESGRGMVKPRLSMFERAVGVFSPPKRPSCGSRRNAFDDTPTPNVTKATPVTSQRRRWGNRNMGADGSTPDFMTPPVRALLRRNSSLKKRRITLMSSATTLRSAPIRDDDQLTSTAKRRKCNPNSLTIEDIPTQVIPRGIAARTNGMTQFLSALKRGIVVRRHRPGAEAVFCKIVSTDGGDTIKYKYVDDEEAILALKEQRVRFNRKRSNRSSSTMVRSIEKRWSLKQVTNESDDFQTFSLPDYIAAHQYRKQLFKDQACVSKKMTDLATKVANSGLIRTADLVAVHPARHEDPRTNNGELGTASLRRSKSEYYAPHTFSLITRVSKSLGKGKLSNSEASEKWHTGNGNDAKFKTIDLEAATEGEYWLLFRGLLLLHRDAASGRYAAQRAAGFGNTRRSVDQGDAETEAPENRLQKDRFKEPPTVSLMEKLIVKWRGIDASYMEGSVAEGAVPPPSDYFLGFRSPGTQIWSRLRQAGLETQRIYALDTRKVMIKVRCPSDRLTDVAEVLRLKLKTRGGTFAPFRENDVAIFQPLNDSLDTPSTLHAAASLFKSSERQTIIDFIIRSRIRDSGAELGQTTDLGKMIDSRVPLHMHGKLDSLYNVWFYFWRRSHWEGRDGTSMAVDHDSARRSCRSTSTSTDSDTDKKSEDGSDAELVPNIFLRLLVGSVHQPLDSIEQYFGENVAFYFAWLQHCSWHLAFLSIAGLIVFICQISTGNMDHWSRPFFAVLVMLWSFVVMVNWRKRSNFLAHRWGTMDYREQETTRPQFKGEYRKDEITGEWVVHYPSWKRWLKYLISFPLTLLFTVGTLILILWIHANRDQLLAHFTQDESTEFQMDFSIKAIGRTGPVNKVVITKELVKAPKFWFIAAGLPALLGLCLPLINFILMRVSIVLNDFENYRTESEYRTHLIIKVFSFRFVCYFATLYYYAFISTQATDQAQAIENGILRVGTGVFISITVSHWWGIFLQIFFPIAFRSFRSNRQRDQLRDELKLIELEEKKIEGSNNCDDDDAKEKRINLINRRLLLDQAQDEVWEEIMLPMHDSFPEYIQAVILFAFVTCFSVMLPITPFICFINHLLNMRVDAYKLCRGRRRPFAHKTGGIGVWEHVLHIVTVIAVLTNCWLMGFTNEQINAISEKITTLGLFAIVVAWEHVMLLIKYVMQASISPLPKSVQDEMTKEQFLKERKRNSNLRAKKKRRSQFKQYSSQLSEPLDSDDRSVASKRFTPSFRQHTDLTGLTSNGKDRGLHTIESESVLSTTKQSKLGEPTTSLQPEARKKSSIRVESPFNLYPPRHSFQTPKVEEPKLESTGNFSGLLGVGLDDNASLSTPIKDESSASFARARTKKEIDDAYGAAAERVRSRLNRREEKMQMHW